MSVDAASKTPTSEFGDTQKADVLNILPPMRGGGYRRGRRGGECQWPLGRCQLDDPGSTAVPGIHVIGDAPQAAPLMPKSGHMANQHGKRWPPRSLICTPVAPPPAGDRQHLLFRR